jgi:hypothetical protein
METITNDRHALARARTLDGCELTLRLHARLDHCRSRAGGLIRRRRLRIGVLADMRIVGRR